MINNIFTLEDALKMSTETLVFFDSVRKAQAGLIVTFDNHFDDNDVFKYSEELNLEYCGCIMDRHGFVVTENTNTKLIPDLTDIIREKQESRRRNLFYMTDDELDKALKDGYEAETKKLGNLLVK